VVGQGITWGGLHAFLHFNGEFLDLNSVLPKSLARHVVLESANAINDHGQVAVGGFDSRTGEWRSYLLTPSAAKRCMHGQGRAAMGNGKCPCRKTAEID
jgi:hypothetical protein